MDARDYFLDLHHAIHFTGKATWTLDEAMQPYDRTVRDGDNSVAWCIWHIARGEDWPVQTMLHDQEQLLTRDGWGERMGVTYPGFGGGMARDEVIPRWTTPWTWVDVFTLVDIALHVADVYHVRNLLVPNREVD